MSKNETAVATKQIKKSYRQFDDNLNEKKVDVVVDFTPAANMQEAVNRLGSDETVITKALNAALQRRALIAKRKEVGGAGIPSAVILNFLKPLRLNPAVSGIEDRKEQTAKLIEIIKGNPFMLDTIKGLAAAAQDDDEDESEEQE